MENTAGMRDRLIHAYFGVDYILLWDTIIKKIPELKELIQNILDDINEK